MRRAFFGLFIIGAIAAAALGLVELRERFPLLKGRDSTSAATAGSSAEPSRGRYDEAKELIRRATLLLRDVARDNPGTGDAYYARIQLGVLENIFKTDIPIAPVPLDDAIVWRVVQVQRTEAHTKITIEIENTNATRAETFVPFDRSPVIIVAHRSVYRMKNTPIERPAGVELYYGERWLLQPTQAIKLDLYFDALDQSVVDGMVKRAEASSREQPARFSLVNVHQSTASK